MAAVHAIGRAAKSNLVASQSSRQKGLDGRIAGFSGLIVRLLLPALRFTRLRLEVNNEYQI